jgi:RNAse (barnase) inhibitor barstar
LEVFIFDIKEIEKAENFNAALLSKFEICSFQKIVTKQTTLWEKATGTFLNPNQQRHFFNSCTMKLF